MVRNVGLVRGPTLFGPIRGPEILSVFSVTVCIFPKTVFNCAGLFEKSSFFGPDRTFTENRYFVEFGNFSIENWSFLIIFLGKFFYRENFLIIKNRFLKLRKKVF